MKHLFKHWLVSELGLVWVNDLSVVGENRPPRPGNADNSKFLNHIGYITNVKIVNQLKSDQIMMIYTFKIVLFGKFISK